MTRKEILALPARERKICEILSGAKSAYIIPNRKKHESGWMCMTIIVTFEDGSAPVLFSDYTDDIAFYGEKFRMDCDYTSGVIRIWNSNYTFSVSGGSSVDFEEESE